MISNSRTQALVGHFTTVDAKLSRTARTGAVATAVHIEKRPARLAGDALRSAIDRNRGLAVEFLEWNAERAPSRPEEISAALTGLAWLTNFGVTAGGLYRNWPYEMPSEGGQAVRPVAPTSIPSAINLLANDCYGLIGLDRGLRTAGIARAEWHIGIGPLHPFYDGCGRVSRYFSGLLCMWLDIPLPQYCSRDVYMAAATAGEATFVSYWKSLPGFSLCVET